MCSFFCASLLSVRSGAAAPILVCVTAACAVFLQPALLATRIGVAESCGSQWGSCAKIAVMNLWWSLSFLVVSFVLFYILFDFVQQKLEIYTFSPPTTYRSLGSIRVTSSSSSSSPPRPPRPPPRPSSTARSRSQWALPDISTCQRLSK